MSRAWKLGCAILRARQEKTDPIQSILVEENGQHLITGKVSHCTNTYKLKTVKADTF